MGAGKAYGILQRETSEAFQEQEPHPRLLQEAPGERGDATEEVLAEARWVKTVSEVQVQPEHADGR